METIDSECESRIPIRLLQNIYVVHVEILMFYRGIDVPGVRTGMSNIYFTALYALNSKAPEGGQQLRKITNDDYQSKSRAWQ